jgi:structural maintenance of chromosome 2
VQFVVVSLKEGMFTNANVLFRTKFVDGVSTVTRTLNAAGSGSTAASAGDGGKAGGGRARAALRENVRG